MCCRKPSASSVSINMLTSASFGLLMCMLKSPRMITFLCSTICSITHSVNSSRNAALLMLLAGEYAAWYTAVTVMSVLQWVSSTVHIKRMLGVQILVPWCLFLAWLLAPVHPFPCFIVGDV